MYSEIAKNKRKTVLLLLIFLLLIGALAYAGGLYYGDFSISIGALLFAIGYALFSYFGAARAALAFNGAREIKKQDNPRLWRIVENLAITEGMQMPRVHIMDEPGLNAFATGRDPKHASVAITTGLLDNLDDSELEGVMAHELGHIKNYDIRVSMVVFGLVAAIAILSDVLLRVSLFGGGSDDEDSPSSNVLFFALGIVVLLLSPIIAALIQAAISRRREYLADATGAMTTRYPEGLARALEKIQLYGSTTRRQNTSTAHLFFANPLKKGSVMQLFSTHPPLEQRIATLRGMGDKV